jgi:hypothetical protein
MISSSLAELDSTFLTNRGSGTGTSSSFSMRDGRPIPYLQGNTDKFYIWPRSPRWNGVGYSTGSVLRLITNPTASDRGTLDPTWKYSLATGNDNSIVRTAMVQSDGKLVVVSTNNTYFAPTGSITSSFTTNGLFRLNTDGTYDSTFNTPVQQAFSQSGAFESVRRATPLGLMESPPYQTSPS